MNGRCRVCLNVTEYALYLHESFSESVEALSYMDILMLCCNIKVSIDDGKPNKICSECMENARTSYEFKICCERSNLILENEIHITSRYIEDIKHEDVCDSFDGEFLSDDTKDLTLAPNHIRAMELIPSKEKMISDANLIEYPILKTVEENTLELDGDKLTTVSRNHDTDSNDSSLNIVKPYIHVDKHETAPNYEVQSYKCECGKLYLHDSNLKFHMRTCILTDNMKLECEEHIEEVQNIQADETILESQIMNVDLSLAKLLTKDDKGQKLYVCKCGKSYRLRHCLNNHLKKCNIPEQNKKQSNIIKDSVHKCSSCGSKFNNFRTLSVHIQQEHTNVGKCSYCDTILVHYTSFIAHVEEHHPDKFCKIISCSICGAVFTLQIHMRRHSERNHKILYECKHCDFTSRHLEGFQSHILDEHGVNEMVEGKNFTKVGDIKKCKYCNYTTTSAIKFGKHMQFEHEDKKTIICSKCGAKFFTNKQLLIHCGHQHRINEKKFVCEVCGMQFTILGNLKHHTKIHIGERSYKCTFCPKAFVQSTTLSVHVRTVHTEERNVKCDACEKCFKTRGALNKHHKRYHARQFNYKCSFCVKAFFNKSDLSKHSVVHTGARLFKCEICKKGFGRKSHLKTHMITHTRETPHVCHVCGKGFTQAHSLRTHLLKH